MKHKWLKLLAMLGCLTLGAGLVACGDKGGDGKKGEEPFISEELVYTINEDGDAYTVTNYIGTAKKVTIESVYKELPVTSIGERVFDDCDYLTEIVIPDSVTSIGDEVFYDCSSLTRVVIPDSVTSIGYGAFAGCSSLTEIIIPDSVTSIGSSAFYYCDSLTVYCEEESQPSGWDSWWNSDCPVVWDCNNNEVANDGYIYKVIDGVRYALKDGVATVVSQPSNITVTHIPETVTYKGVTYAVTSIGELAFAGCDMTKIVIPESVTSIGEGAFQYCRDLTEIVIPDSVTSIGDEVFYDCDSLTIYCEADSQPSGWNKDWNKLATDYSNTEYCSVVWDCKNNDVATDGYIYTVVDGVRYGLKDGVATVVDQPWHIMVANIPKTVGYKNKTYPVTSIGDYAFECCYDLTKVTIPDSVTSIGYFAFYFCDSLMEVVIPDSVTSIGREAFFECGSLTIYCEAKSQPDGWYSWWNSNWPVVWDCKNNDVATDGYTYTVVDGLRYGLKDGVATVVSQPSNIIMAHIPETVTYKRRTYTVTSVGDNAFNNGFNSSLMEVVIPDSVTSIGWCAFRYCENLRRVTFGENSQLTSIGQGAFSSCGSLRNVKIPDSVTSIDAHAFSQCYRLTSVTFGENSQLTSIGQGAFSGCDIMDIVIPDSVTRISTRAFSYCNITKIVIPESVTSIGDNAFENCDSLTSVVIPDSVTSIGHYAFGGCSSLTIYCEAEGKPEGWDEGWNYSNRPVVWGYKGE